MPFSAFAIVENIAKFLGAYWKPIGFVALMILSYLVGCAHVKQQWDTSDKLRTQAEKLVAEQNRVAMALLQKKIADASAKVVVQYVDRIVRIHDQANKLSKEVPTYVTPTDDSRCTVNTGFVRLWTEANTQTGIPGSTGSLDGTPQIPGLDVPVETIKLSDIAEQHIAEVKVFNENAEQLRALQSWIRQQDCLINNHCVADPESSNDGIKATPVGAAPQ